MVTQAKGLGHDHRLRHCYLLPAQGRATSQQRTKLVGFSFSKGKSENVVNARAFATLPPATSDGPVLAKTHQPDGIGLKATAGTARRRLLAASAHLAALTLQPSHPLLPPLGPHLHVWGEGGEREQRVKAEPEPTAGKKTAATTTWHNAEPECFGRATTKDATSASERQERVPADTTHLDV